MLIVIYFRNICKSSGGPSRGYPIPGMFAPKLKLIILQKLMPSIQNKEK